MGLYIAQRIHEHVLEQGPGFHACRRAVDFRPPPSVQHGAIYSLGVDNVLIEGHDAEEVGRLGRKAADLLEAAGFKARELTEADAKMRALGAEQNGKGHSAIVHMSSIRYGQT